MNYFSGVSTVTEIKKLYRVLALKYHPDKGGSHEIMIEINSQYLKALKNADNTKQDGNYTYHYYEETETDIINKINELLKLHMKDVEISLIGSWIWITGETRQYKSMLKNCLCKWHSKRLCWYYSSYKSKTFNSDCSLEELAEKYGSKAFKSRYEVSKVI